MLLGDNTYWTFQNHAHATVEQLTCKNFNIVYVYFVKSNNQSVKFQIKQLHPASPSIFEFILKQLISYVQPLK